MRIFHTALRGLLVLLAAHLLSSSPGTAHAALAYSETVDGDLSGNAFSAPVIALSLGSNEIRGTTGLGLTANDFDNFAILVPTGLQLTSATFTATRTVGTLVNASWLIYNGPAFTSPQIGVLAGNNIPSLGLQFLNTNLPLGPGQYSFAAAGLTPVSLAPALADYLFSFSLSSFPGSTQSAPILPSTQSPDGTFIFTNVPSGSWVDPPLVSGFHYEMTTPGSLFTGISGFPTGFSDPFTVSVGSNVLGQFSPGQSLTFPGSGVSSFDVTGITPLADAADPLAFPLQLQFSTPTASFTMQGIEAQASVPEPATFLAWSTFALLGLIARVGANIGDRVKIMRGALAGVVGRILAFTTNHRCLLAIDGLPDGMQVVISRSYVEAVRG